MADVETGGETHRSARGNRAVMPSNTSLGRSVSFVRAMSLEVQGVAGGGRKSFQERADMVYETRHETRRCPDNHCPQKSAPNTMATELPRFNGQLAQDEIVYNTFFEGKQQGTFLDVGASDGIKFSNTLFFEQLGWRGMCVEANPDAYARLCANRPLATNVFGAAYDKEGEVAFRVNTGYTEQLSGVEEAYDPRHTERISADMAARGGTTRLVTVPCFTLTSLLSSHGITHVDYMSLDVEGAEVQVLKGIDFDRISIGVMTIESNYGWEEAQIDAVLLPRGYRKAGRVGHDLFYAKPSL